MKPLLMIHVGAVLLGLFAAPHTQGEERSSSINEWIADLPERTWVDDSGYHHVRARLVGIGPRYVRLFKENGHHSTLPATRLSRSDQQYVAKILESQVASRGEIDAENSRGRENSVIYLTVSHELLRELSQQIRQEGPMTACILGVPVEGVAHTQAEIDVELVPDNEHAVLDLPIRGTIHSQTTAYPSILEVYTRGLTGFGKRLRLVVDANGATIETVDGWSQSSFVTTGISTSANVLRRLILRIGARQVERRKPGMDVAAARLQRLEIDRAVDSAAAESVKRLNRSMTRAVEEFSQTQVFRGLTLGYTTSSSHLQVVVNLPNPEGLTPPPSIAAMAAPLIVRIHSSALPNTMTEDSRQELQAVVQRLAPLVPNAEGRLRTMLADSELHITESDDGKWLTLLMVPGPRPPSAELDAELARVE